MQEESEFYKNSKWFCSLWPGYRGYLKALVKDDLYSVDQCGSHDL